MAPGGGRNLISRPLLAALSLGGAGERGTGLRERLPAGALLASGEDARQDAVKLFDRQILADITIGSGAQGRVHPFFVVSGAGEDNNRQVPADLSNEGNQRDAIDFRHVKIDHNHVTLMMLEPGGGLEALCQVLARVPFLLEIGHEEFCDGGVVIDEQEFYGSAGQYLHPSWCL